MYPRRLTVSVKSGKYTHPCANQSYTMASPCWTAHLALTNRRYLRLSTLALTALPASTIALNVTLRRGSTSPIGASAVTTLPGRRRTSVHRMRPPSTSSHGSLPSSRPHPCFFPRSLSPPLPPFSPLSLPPSRQHPPPRANTPQRTFVHLVVARALPEEPIVRVGVVAEGAVRISRILAAPAPPTSAAADDSLGRKERERERDKDTEKGMEKERRGCRPLRSNAKDKSAPPAAPTVLALLRADGWRALGCIDDRLYVD
ncbi:hypothetical protein B0H10DRAFT_2225845 [Mycena sp. CBHHK59/15]|nr:hypothetical protein B0H10DRAFT_2225845 [Mycena sp. CBHHK59/15]